jgi:hypothetical protein
VAKRSHSAQGPADRAIPPELERPEWQAARFSGFMAKRVASSCVLLTAICCVLFSSDACAQTGKCSQAVGQWEFKVSGQDCEGYAEEGKFTMSIDADCSMKIDILANIPYAEEFLVTDKSLMVQNDHFAATVDFTVDECGILELKGQIIGGKRIEGTYRYSDGGSGTFSAVKKSARGKKP